MGLDFGVWLGFGGTGRGLVAQVKLGPSLEQ